MDNQNVLEYMDRSASGELTSCSLPDMNEVVISTTSKISMIARPFQRANLWKHANVRLIYDVQLKWFYI